MMCACTCLTQVNHRYTYYKLLHIFAFYVHATGPCLQLFFCDFCSEIRETLVQAKDRESLVIGCRYG